MSSTSTPPRATAMVVPPVSRRRLVGFRACLVFAAILPLLWGSNAIVSAVGGGPHLLHDLIGSGVLLAVLWLAPLAAMWRPRRIPGALLTYHAIVAAAVLAGLLSASNTFVIVVLLVQVGLVTLVHPRRHRALRGTIMISRPLLLVAAVQAVPLAWYAAAEARLQARGDAHAALAHYFDQAWVVLAIALLVALAALRADVRRLAGHLGGVGLTAFGMANMALPDAVSSVGLLWGCAAALGGLIAIVATELGSRGSAARAHDGSAG
jgi:hypothetical protein